ncbi:RNA-directed DNA polymerase, eukaryota, reverse transcriptase zinc-binding domain protein [Tanacetum coccineum]
MLNVPVLNGERDKPMWRKNDGKLVDYSTKTAWEYLRTYFAKVEWHKLVWFTQSIPSHMFVVWLAIHERLQTQEKMLKWNKDPNLKCPLCEFLKCLLNGMLILFCATQIPRSADGWYLDASMGLRRYFEMRDGHEEESLILIMLSKAYSFASQGSFLCKGVFGKSTSSY